MVERKEEGNKERITKDISDWFGRQGASDGAASAATDKPEDEEKEDSSD